MEHLHINIIKRECDQSSRRSQERRAQDQGHLIPRDLILSEVVAVLFVVVSIVIIGLAVKVLW